jgi:hypothetical protein
VRKWLVPLTVFMLIVAPVAVRALTGVESGSVDLQRAEWRTGTISTTSTTWTDVPGLSGSLVCAVNEVSATLSVGITGAQAGFQVQIDDGATLRPGPAYFTPSPTTAFSYTFVINASTFEGSDSHAFDVQWRSPTGNTVNLVRGGVNLVYQHGTC